MIYNVRPSVLGGGGTITSFTRTMTDTHKKTLKYFSPTERDLGSKSRDMELDFSQSLGMSE